MLVLVRLLATLLPCALSGGQADTWPAALSLTATAPFTIDGREYRSSSSLALAWTPPRDAFDHYRAIVADGQASRTVVVSGERRDTTVTDLKAGTRYEATLLACLDADCTRRLQSDSTARASTAEEYWQIRGTGRSYATADRLVDDGNVGSYAFKYGEWAGPELNGRLQLYYNPMQADEKGVKIAESIGARVGSLDDAARFRGISGYGLLRFCSAPPNMPIDPACRTSRSLATMVALFQAVPLTPSAGGGVRLYFEAQGYDGRTRIMHLDSQDGYIGRDFHRGAATRCASLADVEPGGACEPALDIGVDVDGDRGHPRVMNARQFKILYPTRDSFAWDMSPGTPMWFTTEWRDGRCSSFGFNAAYAVWDGARWTVASREDGCPQMLEGVQAPAPVHLGGARYKLYFNRHRSPGGVTDPQQASKPMQMIYADPERTGDATRLEFEDWESLASAREIHYVWPDGALLTEEEESRLDDYVMLAPIDDEPAQLIMYSNMSAVSGAAAPPFIGIAVLINP